MSNVVDIYRHVIDDVIKNVKADFAAEGVDDSTLHELQALWEFKLQQTGATRAHASPPRRSANHGGNAGSGININIAYEPDEYSHTQFQPAHTSSSGEPLVYQYQPPAPVFYQQPAPTHYQHPAPIQYQPQAMAQYRASAPVDSLRHVKPEPFMDPPMHWHRPRGLDVNIAYAEEDHKERNDVPVTRELLGSKRKRDELLPGQSGIPIPQHDGSCEDNTASSRHRQQVGNFSAVLSQWDGADEYHDAVDEEDYNEVVEEEPAVQASTPAPTGSEETPEKLEEAVPEDVEPPLGEDDDEDGLEDVNDGEQEPETNNLVLAQFDKVTRSKNKWKCTLKDGIMHLNGRDTLFTKATGEFEW